MSATFVTDILTVIGLSLLFITPNIWTIPFVVVSLLLIFGYPRIAPWFFGRYGDRVIEPEIKLVFAALFVLTYLGEKANSQAVLPAFVLGLAMSSHYAQHRTEQERLRVVAFAFLTPFFFLKGGLNVSLSAVWANLGILAALLAAKILPKFAGVYPLSRRYRAPHAAFTTLLMSTGLTFGTITSLYGLQSGIIDRTQFSLLITVVVVSAIVPTAIAQRFSNPRTRTMPAPRGQPTLAARCGRRCRVGRRKERRRCHSTGYSLPSTAPRAQRALTKAIELAKVAHASLVALGVEGPLPAYAATIGEVDDVREQKDIFFGKVAAAAEDQADAAGVEITVEVRPGHAAELITHYARECDADLVVVGHKGHFLNDTCSARPPTALPITRTVQS